MLVTDDKAVTTWREIRQAVRSTQGTERSEILAEVARKIRLRILDEIEISRTGHVGGDFSVTDALVALYYAVMDLDPENPQREDRDKFILSKGHCSAAFYAVLASCGYFDDAELATFMANGSPLNGHPNRNKIPGVETNTGPLGHGIPVAVGCALGNVLEQRDSRVFAICGDGELQEGSNWEAFMYAAHMNLSNLTVMVDRNLLQQGAPVAETNDLEPLADKMTAFGWEVREIDGHDFDQLIDAFSRPGTGRPVFVLAHTIKGKPISFMEGVTKFHNATPTPEEFAQARKELGA